MTITVLVPDEKGVSALAGVSGVEAVVYDRERPLPARAEHARVLVPTFLGGAECLRLVDQLPRLELVQLLTAGAELWVGRLPERVLLSTCRGAHGGSTAEWVVAVMLMVYRELAEFDQARRDRRWDQHRTQTLQGKRVLVVGAGDLGQQLRRRLEAFDVSVTMVGRRARPGVHAHGELPELLGQHDAVVLVVPVTTTTTGMVDAEFLARMADGALLVNAARGPVVDTSALLAELRTGRLRAALDVTDPEPLPIDHPLWTVPGLVLTPHVAGSVDGYQDRAYAVAAAEISRFTAGEPLKNLVHGEY